MSRKAVAPAATGRRSDRRAAQTIRKVLDAGIVVRQLEKLRESSFANLTMRAVESTLQMTFAGALLTARFVSYPPDRRTARRGSGPHPRSIGGIKLTKGQ